MTIASEITDLTTNLAAAKTAVTNKGGTVGDTGLAGLASEIATIPSGGEYIAPYGNLYYQEYYTEWYANVIDCEDGEITVTLDQDTFLEYVVYNSDIDSSYIYINVVYDANGSGVWELSYNKYGGSSKVFGTYSDETDLYQSTGINVAWTLYDPNTESKQYAQIDIEFRLQTLSRVDQQGNAIPAGVLYIMDADMFNQMLVPHKPTTPMLNTAYQSQNVLGENIPIYSCCKFVFGANAPATIPDNFLKGALYIKGDMVIPSGVTTIGQNFLQDTGVNSVTVPSSVTSVGTNFLKGCNSLTALEVNTNNSPTDIYSVSATTTSAAAYTHGVIVTGTGQTTWMTNLPNSTSYPYRKLLDEGV